MFSNSNKWVRYVLFSFEIQAYIHSFLEINKAIFWSTWVNFFSLKLNLMRLSFFRIAFKFANLFVELEVWIFVYFRVNVLQLFSVWKNRTFLYQQFFIDSRFCNQLILKFLSFKFIKSFHFSKSWPVQSLGSLLFHVFITEW